MSTHGYRKCPHCEEYYIPDPRNAWHQVYCSKPDCQQARRAANQADWRDRNPTYFEGEPHLTRVQDWRARHPGYWRRVRPVCPSTAEIAAGIKDVILPDLSTYQAVGGVRTSLDMVGDAALQNYLLSQHYLLVGVAAMRTRVPSKTVIAIALRRCYIRGRDLCSSMPGLRLEDICHGPQARFAAGAPAPGAGARDQPV